MPTKAQERSSCSKRSSGASEEGKKMVRGQKSNTEAPVTQNILRHGWDIGHICLS